MTKRLGSKLEDDDIKIYIASSVHFDVSDCLIEYLEVPKLSEVLEESTCTAMSS